MRTQDLTSGWAVACAATAFVALAAVAPVVLDGPASSLVHHAFSWVCHQIPERSLEVAGSSVALCHRCTGVLLGLWAGLVGAVAVLPLLGRVRSSRQGLWLLAAAVPTALDWALGAAGAWPNTPSSRILTGALFGAAAGLVLAANLLAPPAVHPTAARSHAV